MWVFDSTPLIYLAKADRLALVSKFDDQCWIPERVYAEVVTDGLEAGYADARRIERCVDEGIFESVTAEETPLTARLRQNPNLSPADVAVLACADTCDAIAVMDEAAGRTAAEVEEIETRGTAYIVLLCAKEGTISVSEARETIDSMIDAGWYCAPDLYARLVQKLESFDT
ncbi:DUF3368 domain-containing protein [Natronorubrum sp. DTA7]|uniref:DUF3368 domain-containing protein n=1 Tax=Natronorubrum sp. DTA7 TaxID=3447016 RepID=UPI003F8519E1